MAYDLYPAVDDGYNFPPEVRGALARSIELRNGAAPLSEVERNNLPPEEKWNGRVILNTTQARLQRYDSVSGLWASLTEEFDAILSMTTADRDALPAAKVYDGRFIYNKTMNRIQRYSTASSSWRTVGEVTEDVLPGAGATNGLVGTSTEAARADHTHPVGGTSARIDVFTNTGTWTKPLGAKLIEVVVFGGGAGGCVVVNAGGQNSGGGVVSALFPASSIIDTIPITIGAGGNGAPASGAISYGSIGGNSSFGSLITAYGGRIGGLAGVTNTIEDAGTFGSDLAGELIVAAFGPRILGGGGINSQTVPGAIGGHSKPLGAGGGGGASYATASYAGGAGGGYAGGAGGLGGVGTSGGDGGRASGGGGVMGTASGGRGGHGGVAGGSGGSGSIYRTSSIGGNGGRGEVIVITHF